MGVAIRLLVSARSLGRDVRAVTCVFRGRHAEPCITLLPRVYLDRCRLGDHVERCMPQPCSVVPAAAAEGEAQERVGTALAKLLHDLLQQRPSPRRAPHDHLPAALYAQARTEQKLGIAFNTSI